MNFAIFGFCVGISLINILFSVHFISIMLVGILLVSFFKAIDKKYYYSLFFIILTVLIVENTQGFRSFSLVALMIFMYIIIKPNIERIFSSSDILKTLCIVIFYLFIFGFLGMTDGFSITLAFSLFINLFIDIIIVGLFI